MKKGFVAVILCICTFAMSDVMLPRTAMARKQPQNSDNKAKVCIPRSAWYPKPFHRPSFPQPKPGPHPKGTPMHARLLMTKAKLG